MIKSMTGYGDSKLEDDYAVINVEIRSLNSRFFDFYIKSGNILNIYDNQVRNKIKSMCTRGNFQFKASIEFCNKEEVTIDKDRVLDYINMSQQIQDLSNREMNDLSIDKLMSMSDIFKNDGCNYELIKELYFKCIDSAIIELNNSRSAEGKNIEISLQKNIDCIESQLNKISDLSKMNLEKEVDKYNDKIKNIIQDLDIDKSRLYQEVAIMIEKKDIDEEIVRLNSHLSILGDYLNEEGEIGKKINFILQEIGRETNTIGSKSSNTDITYKTLNMKNELEKIREQAQNIL